MESLPSGRVLAGVLSAIGWLRQLPALPFRVTQKKSRPDIIERRCGVFPIFWPGNDEAYIREVAHLAE
jgi:hypothetical protein